MKCTLDTITNIVILSLTVYKAVTRVSFLVRQGVWGPSRSPAGPGQSHVKGFRGQSPHEVLPKYLFSADSSGSGIAIEQASCSILLLFKAMTTTLINITCVQSFS
jgi:hypothetical protein